MDMDQDEYNKTKKIFASFIAKYGMRDIIEVEDITNAYTLHRLSGKGETQKLEHYFIDWMRKHFGDRRSSTGGVGLAIKRASEIDDYTMPTESRGDEGGLLEFKQTLGRLEKYLSRRDKVIIELYLEDASNRDMSKILGVTESRVSQIVTGALEKLRKAGEREYALFHVLQLKSLNGDTRQFLAKEVFRCAK